MEFIDIPVFLHWCILSNGFIILCLCKYAKNKQIGNIVIILTIFDEIFQFHRNVENIKKAMHNVEEGRILTVPNDKKMEK